MQRWLVWLGFAVATALRLWVNLELHPPGEHVISDMANYHRFAVQLLELHTRRDSAFQPLGYPVLLAIAYLLTPGSFVGIAIVQAVLGGLLCVVGAGIATRIGRSRIAGVVTFLLLAVYPPYVFYGALLLTELPTACCVTLALWCLLRPASPRALWQGSLALAAATVMRANLLLLYPLLLLWFRRLDPGAPRAVLRRWARFVGVSLLVFLPFCLHNSLQLGRPTGLATNGGVNFYLARAPVRSIVWHGRFGDHTVTPIPNTLRYTAIEESPVPLRDEAFFYRRGLRQIVEDPGLLWASLDNVREGLGLGRQGYFPDWGPWVDVLGASSRAFFWAIFLPACLGIGVMGLRRHGDGGAHRPWLLGAILVVIIVATSYLYLGDPRMHIPFDAYLIALVVGSSVRLLRGRRLRG